MTTTTVSAPLPTVVRDRLADARAYYEREYDDLMAMRRTGVSRFSSEYRQQRRIVNEAWAEVRRWQGEGLGLVIGEASR